MPKDIVPGKLSQKHLGLTFWRYGIMAVAVVGIETLSFWVMNSPLKLNLNLATILSLFLGIVLNWIGSHYYVFGSSHHKIHKEIFLVFITSLVGVVVQLVTVNLLVDGLGARPVLGKVAAIGVTFFWNYFIRRSYIYKSLGSSVEEV